LSSSHRARSSPVVPRGPGDRGAVWCPGGATPATTDPPYNEAMYYGHASWIALVIFGGMFAIRYLSSQRRRDQQQGRGRPRGDPRTSSSFTGPGRRVPGSGIAADPGGTAAGGSSGTAPGWFADPFVKHEQRYWSGTQWTEHVTDGGVPGTDPPPRPGGYDAG